MTWEDAGYTSKLTCEEIYPTMRAMTSLPTLYTTHRPDQTSTRPDQTSTRRDPLEMVLFEPITGSDIDAADAILGSVGNRARYVVDEGQGQWYGFDTRVGHWRRLWPAEMKAVGIAIGKRSLSGIVNAVRTAEGLRHLHASVHDLDTQPYLFNTRNGTLDLDPSPEDVEIEPGEFVTFPPEWHWTFRPHNPDDLISQVAGTLYDPNAQCTRWDAFLNRVLPNDEVREWLQRLIGYAMVGNQTEAVFPVLYGKGANGKSTFVDIVSELFGSYSCVAEKSLFKVVKFDGHPADRAVLINKRLARSEELPDVELDEPKIKGLTGDDKISGRGMRENFHEWAPTHTFLVHSNTKPRLTGTDDGIWRRVVLVPFEVNIPVEEADPHLKQRLRRELPGILNWALRGYENFCERGLGRPAVLRAAVEEYRAESDTVTTFVERYEASTGGAVFGLIQDHKEYATENGLDRAETAKNYKAVCAALGEMGGKTRPVYNPVLSRTQRAWVGVRPKQ